MYTESYIYKDDANFDIENLELPILDSEEKEKIEYYVEITRHIQEIYELFNIFRFNLNNLLNYYELHYDDSILRKSYLDSKENDFTIINALVLNYISAGKVLTESIENFMNINVDKESILYTSFMDDHFYKIYNKNFYYRFLLHLRNFSQHGHLPISIDIKNRFYFNLRQILYTPTF